MQIKGNGSIVPLENKPRYKCRKWRLFVSTDAGKKSHVFEGKWTDAQKALEAFKIELSEQVADTESFAAYAASWLAYRRNLGMLAPGTIANNEREVNALCRSSLAPLALSTITPSDCKDALIWIKLHPLRKQSPLSNTTMNKIYITLSSIFAQAVDDGRIGESPMKKIKPPKPDTKEKQALSPDELLALISRLSTLPMDGRTMALYFICYLGLRRSEALALYCCDVDLHYVYVRRAVKERNGSIDVPKSPSGTRTLPMPNALAAKVDEWRFIRAKSGLSDALTLCCNTHGKILRPQNFQRWWTGDAKHNGVRDKLECSDITLHQLRHSNLSMISRHMSPYDLQRYAGWSSIEPAKVYVHADMSNLERAVWQIFG